MPHHKKGARGRPKADAQKTVFPGISPSGPRKGTRNPSTPHLSLTEEARNTERRHFWNADLRLRHTQVNFISAATSENVTDQDEDMEPVAFREAATSGAVRDEAKCLNPEQSLADMSLSSKPNLRSSLLQVMRSEHDVPNRVCNLGRLCEENLVSEMNNDLFVVDTSGYGQAVQTGLPGPTVRRSSSSASSSEEEVIVFHGRVHSRKPQPATPSRPAQSRPIIVPRSASSLAKSPPWPRPRSQAQDSRGLNDILGHESNTFESLTAPGGSFRRGRTVRREGIDEGLTDYIANIKEHESVDAQPTKDHRNDLGDEYGEALQDETGPSNTKEKSPGLQGTGWSEDIVHDFDKLSTSSEVCEAIGSVLLKRERVSGVQYLVVWEGYTVDDAKWVPYKSLNTSGAANLIAEFEAREVLTQQLVPNNDTTESDSGFKNQIFQYVAEDILDSEEAEDELDLIKARMTDEQIAHRLAKQEELGLGSAEVMLFDGEETEDLSDEEHITRLKEQAISYTRMTRSRKTKTKSPCVSASVFADVLKQDPYNGFDVMDQDRPSLRRKPKGRRDLLPLELSDSDMETSMHLAWQNDRTKKKLQKQHREELRAQGLIGRKTKLDMKSRYSNGLSASQIKDEIKEFLMSDRLNTSFPPMDKKDRRIVHEIANVFNLKSRSIGGGHSRYPMLYKTSRSIQFSEGRLENVEALLNQRRFLPRNDKRRARAAGPRRFGGGEGGGASGAAVSYRDGEIVGAAAPELGIDNKGHAMLEKMGWSTGTALGALNNKGIMQPVMHTVKTTKAGLG